MNTKEQFTAYITKYALTTGIRKVAVERREEIPSLVAVVGNRIECYHGNDWHRTWESALNRAEEMRAKKIKSLQKSIKAMEQLKFTQS